MRDDIDTEALSTPTIVPVLELEMLPFEEWLKLQEPQYYEDLTGAERYGYQEQYRLVKKLHAVKVELARIQTSPSLLGHRYTISLARFHEFVSNLWKAIDAQDPRVPCGACEDMCVAYTDVLGRCPHSGIIILALEKEAKS